MEFDLAKKHYLEAISIRKDFVEAIHNLAVLIMEFYEDYDKAKELFEQVILLRDDYYEAIYNYSILMITKFKEFDIAKIYLEKLTKVDNINSSAYLILATLERFVYENPSKALEYYNKGGSLRTDNEYPKFEELNMNFM